MEGLGGVLNFCLDGAVCVMCLVWCHTGYFVQLISWEFRGVEQVNPDDIAVLIHTEVKDGSRGYT